MDTDTSDLRDWAGSLGKGSKFAGKSVLIRVHSWLMDSSPN